MTTRLRGHGGHESADVLVGGFGATVAMWAIGYLGRIPPAVAPSWSLGVAMLACFIGGGFVAGRFGQRGWRGGAAAGALSALLNLLILGSLLSPGEGHGMRPSVLLWVPGSLVIGGVLGGLGGFAGSRRQVDSSSRQLTGAFAVVAAAATFLLLIAGGLVTSHGAGLAVVDWPNSFGYNMFLYPLSRMTGGVYYEHAHRLFGALVGLTTVVLAIHLWRIEERPWVRRLGFAAVPLVILQGVLGGLRVTGRFTLSTQPEAMAPSVTLAAVHGVLGQLFFGLVVALAAAMSPTWRGERVARRLDSASLDVSLSTAFVGALFVQLVLGAVQRHLARGLLIHITLAVLVVVLAVAVGVRLAGVHSREKVLRRIGLTIHTLVTVQVALGFGSLAALMSRDGEAAFHWWDVVVRSAHQAAGALLFASAVLATAWLRRLVRQAGR